MKGAGSELRDCRESSPGDDEVGRSSVGRGQAVSWPVAEAETRQA
jgi:hypothetical protein